MGYNVVGVLEDIALIITDASAVPSSFKITGGLLNDRGYSINAVSDGGFVVAAVSSSDGSGLNDLGVVKFQDDLTLCVNFDLNNYLLFAAEQSGVFS